MKKYFKILKATLALALLLSINTISFSQPPPPPPTVGHGTSGNAVPGGGAPIGDGLYLLIGLAGMYGGKKIYDLRKSLKVDES